MTTTTSRSFAAAGVFVVALLSLGYYHMRSQSSITTFAACKDAGYSIMESNPSKCRTPDGRLFVEDVTSSTPGSLRGTEDLIRGINITPHQIVASSFTVEGEARGSWYFEASFPVELIDGNGKQLVIVPAQAKSNWMTTDFVPFSVTLSFEKPTTATGTLILRKDNPSGLPENDKELQIPVRFSTTERTVKLYYYNSVLDRDTQGVILCSPKGLVPVSRTIPVTQTPLQDTITLLLKGEVTSEEASEGITTEFPLVKVALENASLSPAGRATLTFSDTEQKTNGGACRIGILRAAIEATALQFETVKSVVIAPQALFQP